jgi:hypothetical protein
MIAVCRGPEKPKGPVPIASGVQSVPNHSGAPSRRTPNQNPSHGLSIPTRLSRPLDGGTSGVSYRCAIIYVRGRAKRLHTLLVGRAQLPI